jgi:uncharacterized membrane protein YedE/YeeE
MGLVALVLGTAFGWLLSRSGAADYDFVQKMFLLTDLQLYGIIGTAVAVTAPGLFVLGRRGRTLLGRPLSITPKPSHRGNLIGGVIFGIGWSITGMCPGPIFVNLGEGKLPAIAALVGALVGAGSLASLYGRLAGPFGLPPVDRGAGDG